jgi:hypothetical protein
MHDDEMHSIYTQIELARSPKIKDYLISTLSDNNLNLSIRVRNFYRLFLDEAAEDTTLKNIEWWRLIYPSNKKHLKIPFNFISYYRKDSYLLADCPYIFKPTMAIIHPNMPEDYYGVTPDGVALLAKNEAVWLEALHPAKYGQNSKGKNFIKLLSENGRIPLYSDILEDALATYWIENVMTSKGIDVDLIRDLKDYKNNPKINFDDFINTYYFKYLSEMNDYFAKVILNIPNDAVNHRNASLRYNDLRKDSIERLLKVKLLQECLNQIRAEEEILVDFDGVLKSLEFLEKINDPTDKRYAIADFIFKFWQQRGSPWFYSMGNVVDFSGRDLCLLTCGRVNPPQDELDSISIPVYKHLGDLIKNTDIDSKTSIKENAADRGKLLGQFFDDMKSTDIGYKYYCMDVFEALSDQKQIDASEKIREHLSNIITPRISKPKKTISELLITRLISAVPIVGPAATGLIEGWIAFSPHIKNICKYGLASPSSLESLSSIETEYYSMEDAVTKFDGTIPKKFSYSMHALQLPYDRSESKYQSGNSINTLASN